MRSLIQSPFRFRFRSTVMSCTGCGVWAPVYLLDSWQCLRSLIEVHLHLYLPLCAHDSLPRCVLSQEEVATDREPASSAPPALPSTSRGLIGPPPIALPGAGVVRQEAVARLTAALAALPAPQPPTPPATEPSVSAHTVRWRYSAIYATPIFLLPLASEGPLGSSVPYLPHPTLPGHPKMCTPS